MLGRGNCIYKWPVVGYSIVNIKSLKEFFYGWAESRAECEMRMGIWRGARLCNALFTMLTS